MELEEKNIRYELATSLQKYPEFLSSEHLVQLGIYKSLDAAYQARVHGDCPKYIKMKHKMLYTKKAVIDFLAERHMTDSLAEKYLATLQKRSKEKD